MMFKIHVIQYPETSFNDHNRLIRLLSEGYKIIRADSTRDAIVYVLEKTK